MVYAPSDRRAYSLTVKSLNTDAYKHKTLLK